MSNNDILDQLERILKIYEKTKEMEMRRAEISAKIASDILAENRRSQLELMQYFSKFINPGNKDKDG